MHPHPRERASVADYLQRQDAVQEKLEYVDGHIVAMSGGTFAHAELIERVFGQFLVALSGRACRAHSSAKRFRSPVFGNIRYPDGMVTCGDIAFDDEDTNAVTNPTLVLEVLSPTTEGVDRGRKSAEYRSTPSVQHLLFVSSTEQRVELFTRQADGSWLLRDHAGGTIALPAIDAALDLDALYAGLDLPLRGPATSEPPAHP